MSKMQKMIKQAKSMHQQLQDAQGDLGNLEVSHSCNGIAVVAKGDMTLKSISIDPTVMKEADHEMLQDLILVAINGALEEARKQVDDRVSGITGGLNIPGLF